MSIKILHTSDWHLGKKLFKISREQEHQYYLNWLVEYIKENQIDLLFIAGDIFDVPAPDMKSMKLLYDFIYKLGQLKTVETVLITGNHDSNYLLNIPGDFFREHNCHIFTKIDSDLEKNNFYFIKNGQTIGIKTLPYFRNYELVNLVNSKESESETDNQQQITKYFKRYFSHWNRKVDHKILISHHVYGNYSLAGSEHAIHLSGVEHFPISWVEDQFDYIALGHIHKYQELSSTTPIIYSGSPIPMRFSESSNKNMVEITIENNQLSYKKVTIKQLKQLTQIKCKSSEILDSVSELISKTSNETAPTLLEIIVEMEQVETGVQDKIRDLLLATNIELISYIPIIKSSEKDNINYEDINKLNLPDLFELYYKNKFPEKSIPPKTLKLFKEIISEARDENT